MTTNMCASCGHKIRWWHHPTMVVTGRAKLKWHRQCFYRHLERAAGYPR